MRPRGRAVFVACCLDENDKQLREYILPGLLITQEAHQIENHILILRRIFAPSHCACNGVVRVSKDKRRVPCQGTRTVARAHSTASMKASCPVYVTRKHRKAINLTTRGVRRGLELRILHLPAY